VLDRPLATDSKLGSTRTTSPGDAGDGIRHLSHDELGAYVDGRLTSARLSQCSSHLDSCEACRAELEDLRTLRAGPAGLVRPEPLGRELDRRRRNRHLLTAVQIAVVAVISVTVISTAVWWGRGRLLSKKATPVASVTHAAPAPAPAPAPTPVPTSAPTATSAPTVTSAPAAAPAPTSRPASASRQSPIASGPAPQTRSVARVDSSMKGATPAVAVAQPSVTAAETNRKFELLGPFGDTVTEARPEFRWTPVPGAVRYSVAIVDDRLHPVQRSRALRTTSWRPRRPLHRGRTYLWQVTAKFRNGSTLVATGPTSSGALLRITPK
jgi:anti-sigma factor RsiW